MADGTAKSTKPKAPAPKPARPKAPATKAAKPKKSSPKPARPKAAKAPASEAGPAKERVSRPRRAPKAKAVEDLARSYFSALAARDPESMARHFHADGVDDIVPVGVLRGPAGVREFFAELFAAVPDFETTVERVTADDRVAAVQWRSAGHFTGRPFQGIEATGRRVELRGCDCVEVEDGVIVGNTAFYDGAAFARAIGLLPPQDSSAERALRNAFNGVTRVRRAVAQRTGGPS